MHLHRVHVGAEGKGKDDEEPRQRNGIIYSCDTLVLVEGPETGRLGDVLLGEPSLIFPVEVYRNGERVLRRAPGDTATALPPPPSIARDQVNVMLSLAAVATSGVQGRVVVPASFIDGSRTLDEMHHRLSRVLRLVGHLNPVFLLTRHELERVTKGMTLAVPVGSNPSSDPSRTPPMDLVRENLSRYDPVYIVHQECPDPRALLDLVMGFRPRGGTPRPPTKVEAPDIIAAVTQDNGSTGSIKVHRDYLTVRDGPADVLLLTGSPADIGAAGTERARMLAAQIARHWTALAGTPDDTALGTAAAFVAVQKRKDIDDPDMGEVLRIGIRAVEDRIRQATTPVGGARLPPMRRLQSQMVRGGL